MGKGGVEPPGVPRLLFRHAVQTERAGATVPVLLPHCAAARQNKRYSSSIPLNAEPFQRAAVPISPQRANARAFWVTLG